MVIFYVGASDGQGKLIIWDHAYSVRKHLLYNFVYEII